MGTQNIHTESRKSGECADPHIISAFNISPSKKLGQGNWERAESGVFVGICRELGFVISSFLVHRHLPEAAVQNQDQTCHSLHPTRVSLGKRTLGGGRGVQETHAHPHYRPPTGAPTPDPTPPGLERRLSSTRLEGGLECREDGEHGRGGSLTWSEAWSMLPSCGNIRKCARSASPSKFPVNTRVERELGAALHLLRTQEGTRNSPFLCSSLTAYSPASWPPSDVTPNSTQHRILTKIEGQQKFPKEKHQESDVEAAP